MSLIPVDVSFTLYQGCTLSKSFILNSDGNTAGGVAIDFTGWTAFMQIRATHGSEVHFIYFTTENGGITLLDPPGEDSTVEIFATADQTAQIPGGKAVYDIVFVDAADNTWRGQEGKITVTPQVTRRAVAIAVDVDTKVTELDITATIANGTTFSTAASGTGYTMSGDIGNVAVSEAFFENSIQHQIDYNGVRYDKSDDITWVSSTTFKLTNDTVNLGDKLTIYSA